MAVMRYAEAIRLAMTEEMERDDAVFICGEEVAQYQGTYRVTEGMLQKFGPRRVVDTPISEIGIAGLATGAAMVGLKPIAEFMTWSFALEASHGVGLSPHFVAVFPVLAVLNGLAASRWQ
ncbi:MAG: hypothetical protein ABJA67_11690, partial [Chthonomonadales bacterium]